MSEFSEVFQVLAKQVHVPPGYRYPSQMIEEWTRRVTDLSTNGYGDCLDEYDNDLSVRGNIEKMLNREELSGFEEFKKFQMEVQKLDDILKHLFLPNVQRFESPEWWIAGILKNGYGDYAAYIKEVYRISLEGC